MANDTEVRADGQTWVGDLSSLPDKSRRLWDQEVHSLHYIINSGLCPPHEKSTMLAIISERQAMLHAELIDPRYHFLDAMVRHQIHHQLRVRADFRTETICVEQWVPAHRAWLVTGYFPSDTEANEIIYQLQKGDPRYKSMTDAYEEAKAAAELRRKQLDAEGTEKVVGAVDSLSTRAREQFIEVEEALKTGETIIAHGDDLAHIENGIELTKKAARAGEVEAQRVLTRGQSDNALCVNPGDNPIRR